MQRYHIKTGFEDNHVSLLKDFTEILNDSNFSYSIHALDSIQARFSLPEIEKVLLYIKGLIFDCSTIFEYYAIDSEIIKVCYRIAYSEKFDIILVMNSDKKIITIYINSVGDNHETLHRELYNK